MARPFEEQSAAIDIKPPALVKTEGPAQPHLFTVSVQGKKKKKLPACQSGNKRSTCVPSVPAPCRPAAASKVSNWRRRRRSGTAGNERPTSADPEERLHEKR